MDRNGIDQLTGHQAQWRKRRQAWRTPGDARNSIRPRSPCGYERSDVNEESRCDKKSRGSSLIARVDMVIRVGERALDGEDDEVSNLLPRSVVTASVTTLVLDVRNREVLFDQSLVELG